MVRNWDFQIISSTTGTYKIYFTICWNDSYANPFQNDIDMTYDFINFNLAFLGKLKRFTAQEAHVNLVWKSETSLLNRQALRPYFSVESINLWSWKSAIKMPISLWNFHPSYRQRTIRIFHNYRMGKQQNYERDFWRKRILFWRRRRKDKTDV